MKLQRITALLLTTALAVQAAACANTTETPPSTAAPTSVAPTASPSPTPEPNSAYPPAEPLDDKFRTYYEAFVYSFADSNGDGIGDFQGLTDKLDYLNDGDPATMTDLGINGLWLMPIMPSPTYHKYDVLDYYEIDPEYGTMADFENFLAQAHERGIDVILDLVMNHTAVDHPWFKQAVEALKNGDTQNPYVSYYHFSETQADGTWYPTGADGWFYEGKFWSGMPDLNLESEHVRQEFTEIMEFWLVEKGVDGFRLDAVKEFYTGQDSKNIEVLTWINDTAKALRPDAYLVGEAWTTFQGYKQYYASGIDSFMDFAFADYAGITVKDINLGNGKDYANNLAAAQKAILEINPDGINAPFMSNHDTGRLAGFLAEDPAKLRLAAAANLFTSGNSFIYYGEEVGMKGSGIDENKRAPMPWTSSDSPYMTNGPLAMEADGYAYPFGSVEEQEQDPASLLNYYKEAIRIRTLYPEIARGLTTVADGFVNQSTMAVEKNNSETGNRSLVMMNFSWESREEVLPAAYSGWELVATLPTVDLERAELAGGTLEMPPYSVAVLKPLP